MKLLRIDIVPCSCLIYNHLVFVSRYQFIRLHFASAICEFGVL